jgi:hypothetical protein
MRNSEDSMSNEDSDEEQGRKPRAKKVKRKETTQSQALEARAESLLHHDGICLVYHRGIDF